jgi:hypothetical protein
VTCETEALLAPNPFLFLDLAVTPSVLPDFKPLIVQEVFSFYIVQDFPPAVTLLPVIFEPPSEAGNVIVTVTLTLPFFGVEDTTEVTVGSEGFVTLACAGASGAIAKPIPSEVATVRDSNLLITKV